MATLTERHKAFLITRLACYDSPSKVKEAFIEEYNTELSLSQISYYDPSNRQGSNLAEKWVTLFNETRRQFIEDTSAIPVAQKSFRLKCLHDLFERLEGKGNLIGAAGILEQAAKETGGMFTNKRDFELSGSLSNISMQALSDNQLERIAAGEHILSVLASAKTAHVD